MQDDFDLEDLLADFRANDAVVQNTVAALYLALASDAPETARKALSALRFLGSKFSEENDSEHRAKGLTYEMADALEDLCFTRGT